MDQVEILPHEISLVLIYVVFTGVAVVLTCRSATPLVPASAGLFKAAYELDSFRAGQLGQSTASCDTAGRALWRIFHLVPHLHVHEVIHAQSRL